MVAHMAALNCLIKVGERDGIAAVYKGMYAKFWQVVLTSALHSLTYEQLQIPVFMALRGSDPGVSGR